MSGQDPVTRRAPGKLFVVGEYAVMEPGTPALLVAVDRLVTVTATPIDRGVTIVSDIHPPARLHWRGTRLTGETPDDEQAARGPVSHAVAALEVVGELLVQRGGAAPAVELAVSSDLHDAGTKLGLGSSGAVTVAAVAAVAAGCGIALDPQTHFRLAMVATARLDPRSSGGDLAAGIWRGWVSYRSPDRAAVLDLVGRDSLESALRAEWPGLSIRRVAAPAGLRLAVGWTGRPASTGELVTRPAATAWADGPSRRAFLTDMTGCVRATVDALEAGDGGSVIRQIRSAHRLLARLDETAGLGIFTDELRALCEAAEASGWAAKPSGAGGGDCGIAVRADATDSDVERLWQRWQAAGIAHLPISILDDAADRMVS